MSNLSANPYTEEVAMTSADTEYSFTFPLGTTAFLMQLRAANDSRYAWATGVVATPNADRVTLKSGHVKFATGVALGVNDTIFFASGSATQVMELEVWT